MTAYEENLRAMLRSLRRARGYSQERVAAQLGVSRSTYTYYETGKSLPSVLTLKRLAEIFGILPEAFFHPEDYLEANGL